MEMSKVKRIMETIRSYFLVIVCLVLISISILLGNKKPTERITAESYASVKNRINNVNTWQLDFAKTKFENAIEEAGYTVDDGVVQIWEDNGMTTIAYLWKSGKQYYNTQVRNAEFQYPYKEAVYIQGFAYSGNIQSARYDNSGYIIVDSNINIV